MNEPTWYVGIHLRMRGAYSIFFVVHILPLSPTHMGQITDFLRDTLPVLAHPRAYGAGTVRSTSGSRRLGSSPCIRGRRQMVYYCTCSCGLIPVHTGQALNPSRKSSRSMDKRFLLRRLPTIKSVCIISFRYIFADNTFWSKNRRIQNPSAIQKISSSGQCIRLFTQKQGVTGEHPYFNVQNKKNWIPASCLKSILIP